MPHDDHPSDDDQSGQSAQAVPWRPVLAGKVFAIVLCAWALEFALDVRLPGINGPMYWHWPYQRLDAGVIYPWFALAALPVWIGVAMGLRRASRHKAALCLLMAGMVSLQLANLAVQSPAGPIERAGRIVAAPVTTGYFEAAETFVQSGGRLGDYAAMLQNLPFHARTKPCGPVLAHLPFTQWSSRQAATQAAAMTWLWLSCLSVPATYLLVKRFGDNATAALFAAALFTLSPGMVGLAVSLDPLYPALTAAMMLTWDSALVRRRRRDAVIFAAVLTFTILFVYNVLVLGALLAGMTVWRWLQGMAAKRLAIQVGIAIGTTGALCLIIYLFSGYNVVEAFLAAYRAQARLLAGYGRTWPRTIVFDLIDFGWAGGWIPVLLVGFGVRSMIRRSPPHVQVMVALGLGQIVLTAVAGLLQAETMRVWLFMLPLLLLPASLELARWPRWAGVLALAMVWWMCVVVNQNFQLVAIAM